MVINGDKWPGLQVGVAYSELGGVIEDITQPRGVSSVRNFCGHGLGHTC